MPDFFRQRTGIVFIEVSVFVLVVGASLSFITSENFALVTMSLANQMFFLKVFNQYHILCQSVSPNP